MSGGSEIGLLRMLAHKHTCARNHAQTQCSQGDVLSLMAQLQGLKHRKMLRERDEWLEKRHAFQRKDAKWELRTQNDDRLENELMSQLEQLQVDPVTSVWAIPTLCHDRS